MDLGLMTEGFVELDPMSGQWVLRIPQANGTNEYLDMQEVLGLHQGKEVRLIITPLDVIATLAEMIELGEVDV
jgi:hypothetical protein